MSLLEIPPQAEVERMGEVVFCKLPDGADLERRHGFYDELVRMAEAGNAIAIRALEVGLD